MPQLTPIARQKLFNFLIGAGATTAVALSGTALIAPNEGLVLETYLDAVGIVTACYGHTGPELKLGMKFTVDQCNIMLLADLKTHNQEMRRYVAVPLTEYQEAAFTSFVYNAGVTNFRNSTMLKLLNKGDYKGACNQLTSWVYAKGIKLKGLVTRRGIENDACQGKLDLRSYAGIK